MLDTSITKQAKHDKLHLLALRYVSLNHWFSVQRELVNPTVYRPLGLHAHINLKNS